jgi:type I restriction enzyme M protein
MMKESDEFGAQIEDGRIETIHSDVVALWDFFDQYRGSNRYEIIPLLILALYRDGYVNRKTVNQGLSLFQSWQNTGKNISSRLTNRYAELFDLLSEDTTLLQTKVSLKAFEALTSVHPDSLLNSYETVFQSVVESNRPVNAQYYSPPKEIIRLMVDLANAEEYDTVYNPFAGVGGFLNTLPEAPTRIAQEQNRTAVALALLRVINQSNEKYNIKFDDPVQVPPFPTPWRYAHHIENDGLAKFDLIVSCPPLNHKVKDYWVNGREIKYTASQAVITEGLNHMNSSGRIIILVAQSFLFSGGLAEALRRRLIEEDVIERIISLPAGAITGTGIITSILVINKNKVKKGIIQLVNASSFFTDKARSGLKLIRKHLLAEIMSGKESKHVGFISTSDTDAWGYNLEVKRLTREHYEGVALKSILSKLPVKGTDLPEGEKLVGIKELRTEDDLLFQLKKDELSSRKNYKAKVLKIEQTCLLVALKGDYLKPTSFEYQGQPIFVGSNVGAFKVNDQKSFPDFMVHTLRDELVAQQAGELRSGITVPSLGKGDFLKLRVELPPLEKQHAKVQSLYEVAEKFAALKAERAAIVTNAEVKHFDDFSSLKHTIGHARENILGWADNLHFFLKEKYANTDTLNKSFEEFFGENVNALDALEQIKQDITFISNLLEEEEKGLVLTDYSLEVTSIAAVKKCLISATKGNYQFSTTFNLTSEEVNSRGSKLNLELLKVMVVNLLVNADKHGFSQEDTNAKKVVIDLQAIGDRLILTVKNNGAPFPKNYGKLEYTTLFRTSDEEKGTGIGGYDVNRIANYFKAKDWQLFSNAKEQYPVAFIFEFPLEQI